MLVRGTLQSQILYARIEQLYGSPQHSFGRPEQVYSNAELTMPKNATIEVFYLKLGQNFWTQKSAARDQVSMRER